MKSLIDKHGLEFTSRVHEVKNSSIPKSTLSKRLNSNSIMCGLRQQAAAETLRV